MQVFRGLPALTARHRPIALTLGNFDGVHRGHQAMLARLTEAAEDLALPSAVLTFDPHPREFFEPGAAPPRLSTLRDKLERLAACGVTEVHIARFDAALAAMRPETFVDEVLEGRLETRWVLVGDDFRFGKGRSGDLAVLRRLATRFSVEAMPTVVVDGERASSSAVRAALAAGQFERATRLLGRPHAVTGRVAHGDKLGRKLGFPTANIVLRHASPLTGVFTVRVHGLGQTSRAGVASVGVRPTVKADAKPLLEVFVFDFDEACYGRRVTVDFLHKLRDEARYPDLDTLSRQIQADVLEAREYFAAGSTRNA